MVPDEEAVSLAALISVHEGIAIKGEDLITILNAAGIKVNQYHSNFAAILEKIDSTTLRRSLPTNLPCLPVLNLPRTTMRDVFRRVAYTTLVPLFLAFKQAKHSFKRLLLTTSFGYPSPLRPLVLEAVQNNLTPGGFGSCAEYYSLLSEGLGTLTCLASNSHCVAMTRDRSLYLDPSYYFHEKLLTETPVVSEPLLDSNTRVETRLVNDVVEQQKSKFDEAGTWVSRKGYKTLKPTDINEFKERIWTNNHLRRCTHYINIKGPFPEVAFEIIINFDIFFAVIESESGESTFALRDPQDRLDFLASCHGILSNSNHVDSFCFSQFLGQFIEGVVAVTTLT